VLSLYAAAINQVGGIGLIGRDKCAEADAEQSEPRAVRLMAEKIFSRRENPVGKLGRRLERTRARSNPEVGGF
jgi:hypothetical protein